MKIYDSKSERRQKYQKSLLTAPAARHSLFLELCAALDAVAGRDGPVEDGPVDGLGRPGNVHARVALEKVDGRYLERVRFARHLKRDVEAFNRLRRKGMDG